MDVTQRIIHSVDTDISSLGSLLAQPADIILVFASPTFFRQPALLNALSRHTAPVIGCSTSGEIAGADALEDTAVVTAINLAGAGSTSIYTDSVEDGDYQGCGKRVGTALNGDALRAVLLLTRGIDFLPTGMLNGIHEILGEQVLLCGGMAGDNATYTRTFVLTPEGISDHKVVAVGFYGENLCVQQAIIKGWQPFGPIRQVTRSVNNILYELDGKPALDIYKKYLGDYAGQLPMSGLLFPLELMNSHDETSGLLRALYSIDESDGSLVLGGKIKQGAYLRLNHASTNDLISDVEDAAALFSESVNLPQNSDEHSNRIQNTSGMKPGFALVVSCVARKVVMGDQVEEEVEALSGAFSHEVPTCGFYSNGEFGPKTSNGACKLHNQTMIVTLFGENGDA